jgi:hypothetical protein
MRLVRGYAISANVRSEQKEGVRRFLARLTALPAAHLTESSGFEGDADRAVNDIARCVRLYVSDQIVADPKLQVLKPGQGQKQPP